MRVSYSLDELSRDTFFDGPYEDFCWVCNALGFDLDDFIFEIWVETLND
jgi:hypothetical protein